MNDQDWAELDAARGEFNGFLHVLRTQQLRRVPEAGGRFLSAGCSGRWYFDWVADNYCGTIHQHLGVEAFSPEPPDLPDNVSWLTDRLGAMHSVADGSVDMVFAGQVIEHLWADEAARFVLEAWRVLRPGGLLVMDSPNRSVSERLGWVQPEHTAEFAADEIGGLLDLAGFRDIELTGLWACVDPASGRTQPLDPSEDPHDQFDWRGRVQRAATDPARSFVWWVCARRDDRPPDEAPFRAELERVHDQARAHAVARANTRGTIHRTLDGRVARAAADQPGHLLFGPYIPMPAGEYVAEFAIEREHLNEDPASGDQVVALVDVTTVTSGSAIAACAVTRAELESVPPGGLLLVEVPFTLAAMTFGFERRVLSTGVVDLGVVIDRTRVLPACPAIRSLAQVREQEPFVAAPAPADRPLSVRADSRRLAASLRNALAARAVRVLRRR